jgi:GNAT superfamily N-acetyltransferase
VDDDILIRRIERDEGPTLRRLRLRSLADAPDAFGQRIEEAVARPEAEWTQLATASAEGENRAWFVAFAEAEPVGLVQGRRRRPETLLLFSMWVAPEARRRRVGAQLIDALESWARDWHATETVLWVLDGNEAAFAFYERLGFKRVQGGPDAESGAQHGALAMRRTIAS